MSKNINVGVIGCEMSGDLFQLNTVNKQEKLHFRKLFCETDSTIMLSAFPGMEVVNDVKAILHDADIELVFISNNHLGLITEAVAAGKAVRVAN